MSLRPHQFRILREFLDSLGTRLRLLEEVIRRCGEAISGIRDEKKAEQEIQREISRQILVFSLPKEEREANNASQERRHREDHRIQRWIMRGTWFTGICTLAAFVAAAYYANQARKQSVTMNRTYCEIQKQTALMRDQLVGTQAAIINLAPSSWNGERSMQLWAVNIVNRGSLVGSVSLTAQIQKKTPTGQFIGEPIVVSISDERIKGGGQREPTLEKVLPWRLPELDKNGSMKVIAGSLDIPIKWPGNEIVTVEGSYTYNDGFQDMITHKFCYIWLPNWDISMPDGSGYAGGGGWSGGIGDCPTIQEKSDEFRVALRDAESHWESDRPRPKSEQK